MTKYETIDEAMKKLGINPNDKDASQILAWLYEAGYRAGHDHADANPRQPESMGR